MSEVKVSGGNKWAVVILVVIVMAIIGSCMNSSSVPRSDIEQAIDDTIRPQLINPSGAEFSPDDETTITDNGDGTYDVTGWVDCTNALGASIRNNYRATVTKEDDGFYVEPELQNAITGEWQ